MKLIPLAALFFFALHACSVDAPDPGEGLYACDTDEDCAEDYTCVGGPGRCVQHSQMYLVGGPCGTHQDCNNPPALFCADGMCMAPCEFELDDCSSDCMQDYMAPLGYTCAEGCFDKGCPGDGICVISTYPNGRCASPCGGSMSCAGGNLQACVTGLQAFGANGQIINDVAVCKPCEQQCSPDHSCFADQGSDRSSYEAVGVFCGQDPCGCNPDHGCVFADPVQGGRCYPYQCSPNQVAVEVQGPVGAHGVCIDCLVDCSPNEGCAVNSRPDPYPNVEEASGNMFCP